MTLILNEYSTPAEVLQVAEVKISELMAERSEVVGIIAEREIKGHIFAALVGQLAQLLIEGDLHDLTQYWQNRLDYAYRMQAKVVA